MLALIAALVVAAALVGLVCWLVGDALRQRRSRAAAIRLALHYSSEPLAMGRHDEHRDDAVTVAELLTRAAEHGRALRLNWSLGDTDPAGLATVEDGDDWPTGVLPRITGDTPDPRTSAGEIDAPTVAARSGPSGLPRTSAIDPDLLERVLKGLRQLE